MLLVIVFMLTAGGSLGDRPGKKLTTIPMWKLRSTLAQLHDDVSMDRIAFSPNVHSPAVLCNKDHKSCYNVSFSIYEYHGNKGMCFIWRGSDYDQNEYANTVLLARDVQKEVDTAFTVGPDWGREARFLRHWRSPDLVYIRNCGPTLYSGLLSKYYHKGGILHMSDILSAMKESGYRVSQHPAPLFDDYVLDLTLHNFRLLFVGAEKIPATPSRLFDAGQAKAVESTEEAARRPPTYAMVLAWSGLVGLLAMLGAISLIRCTRANQMSAAEVDDTVGHLMQENNAEAERDGATCGFA